MQSVLVLKDYMDDICGIFTEHDYLVAARDKYLIPPDYPERRFWTKHWGYPRDEKAFTLDFLYTMCQENKDIYKVVFDYETLAPRRVIKMTPTPILGRYLQSDIDQSDEVVVVYGVWAGSKEEAVTIASGMCKVIGIRYGLRVYSGTQSH